MGIKEKKARNKELFRRQILTVALALLERKGLEKLTLRGIAQRLGCSQSKIYECFRSKDHLCEAICELLCAKLIERLQTVSDSSQRLPDLIQQTLAFHQDHPHSAELFTLVCYTPARFTLPPTFRIIESYFIDAVRKLDSPYIQTHSEVDIALNCIRCFFIGITTIAQAEISPECIKGITEGVLGLFQRGWK